jgi:hypothetical protein
MNRSKTNEWLFAVALATPLLIFFIAYLFNHADGLIPTGFSQYDNVSYLAYAKQYTDTGSFHLGYSNPFNDGPSSTIYFQPQILFFGLLLYLGIPAGFILIPFVVICSIICFRLIIAIYDVLVSNDKKRVLHIWLFSWGGGLLVLGSAVAHGLLNNGHPFLNDLFLLDPEGGWWGLNLGRSLLFSCEAYYHAIFLACIYSIIKKKWPAATLLLLLMSLSHPFTGIELTGIVSTWCFIEYFFYRRSVPVWFMFGSAIILCFHFYYYLIYLNQFQVHRSVRDQYALNWRLGWYRLLPAYCIVGGLALYSIFRNRFRTFFGLQSNRLFGCWFLIAFLLANHDIFIRPMQPIHFTRGYIWTSLFLLGLPALQQLTNFVQGRWRIAGIAIFASAFFLDNFLWIATHSAVKGNEPYATYINPEQKNILNILDGESTNETLIVSSDETVGYLTSVYTKGWPWYSHPYTTPFAGTKRKIQADFFNTGKIDSSWMDRKVNFVLRRTDSVAFKSLLTLPAEKILKTRQYIIFEYVHGRK